MTTYSGASPEDIENDGQVQESCPRRKVRDVRHPELIGCGRHEMPIDEIGLWRRSVSKRRALELPSTDATPLIAPHQTGDPLDPDERRIHWIIAKVLPYAGRAVRPVGAFMESSDPL